MEGIATATCAPADGHAMAAGKDDEQRAVPWARVVEVGAASAAGSPDAVHVLEPDDLATLRTDDAGKERIGRDALDAEVHSSKSRKSGRAWE